MSLIWFEGFDHYKTSSSAGNAHTAGGWTGLSNGAGISAPTTRHSSGKWGQNCGNYSLDASYNEVIIGFAYYKSSTTTNVGILTLRDSANNDQVFIGTDASSKFVVRRGGSGGTILGTSTTGLSAATWTYLELRVKVNDTTGTVDFRINNINEISLTGQDTKSTAVDGVRTIVMGASQIFDDMYLLDPTVGGAPWNDFLGDCRVETVFPSSNDSVQFTPSASTNNTNVDEDGSDDDTTYNESSTTGHIDTYNMNDLSGTPYIYGVAVHVLARKDDVGIKSIKTKLISGGTTSTGSANSLGSTYVGHRTQYQTDPNTAAQWTAANVNALKAGYEAV